MYDYRQDLIKLLKQTKNETDSLNQTLTAIEIIINVLKQDQQSIVPLSETKQVLEEEKQNAEQTVSKNNEAEKNVTPKKSTEPVYTVQRLLNGANIINQNDQQIQHLSETAVRNLGLENGNEVAIIPNNHHEYDVVEVLNRQTTDSHITTFGPVAVKHGALGLFCQTSIDGKELSSVNSSHSLYLISSKLQHDFDIHEGDVLTLAWYNANPDNIKVRWKYDISQDAAAKPAKSSQYKTKTPKSDNYQPALDYDLDGRTVALVAADDSSITNLDKVVLAHNGIPKVVASENSNSIINRVSNCDLIILFKSYINHEISQTVIDLHHPVAMSEKNGQLSLEKAIYRALNGLNVSDNGLIEYPAV